jgi:hypothetical protein
VREDLRIWGLERGVDRMSGLGVEDVGLEEGRGQNTRTKELIILPFNDCIKVRLSASRFDLQM